VFAKSAMTVVYQPRIEAHLWSAWRLAVVEMLNRKTAARAKVGGPPPGEPNLEEASTVLGCCEDEASLPVGYCRSDRNRLWSPHKKHKAGIVSRRTVEVESLSHNRTTTARLDKPARNLSRRGYNASGQNRVA
jgi:hypothetical protein